MGLKELVNAFGVSGYEDEVRGLIRSEALEYGYEIFEDKVGNLFVHKKGRKRAMLGAHIDEVGLMIIGIEKDGRLRFRPVGGIDPRVLLAKQVRIGKDKIPGVIGAIPVHLIEDKDKVLEAKSLYIDIGARDKADAERYVKPGDYVFFDSPYQEKDGVVFGKAFDDRVGCLLLLNLIKRDPPPGVIFLFSIQEEVGLRGAKVVAEHFEPDLFISVEATGAGDLPVREGEPGWPKVGSGPAITIADRSLIVPQDVVDLLVASAERAEVPYQFKRPLIGGTDAGIVGIAKAGIKAGVVAVPVRYIHSPIGMVKLSDVDNTEALLFSLLIKTMEG